MDLTLIPDAELHSEVARRRSLKRGDKVGGRPVVLKMCWKCGESFPARILRSHLPKCQKEMK
jgi:hypothetical protein